MLIIPEAKIFHEKNDLEFCICYWSHYNNTAFMLAQQLKSMNCLKKNVPECIFK